MGVFIASAVRSVDQLRSPTRRADCLMTATANGKKMSTHVGAPAENGGWGCHVAASGVVIAVHVSIAEPVATRGLCE